ncbi:MAG: CBS domain-containing protein [Desulfotomaculales bacterium]
MSPLAGPAAIAEETVLSAALKMLASRVNSLPVLEDGQVIGIIRTIDIFQVIGELLAEN